MIQNYLLLLINKKEGKKKKKPKMSSEKFLQSFQYSPLMGGEAAADEETSVPTTSAVPVEAAAENSSSSNTTTRQKGCIEEILGPTRGHQNHLLCGCCCDVRRATLVMNLITIILNIITMIGLFVYVRVMGNALYDYDYDNYMDIAEDIDFDQTNTVVDTNNGKGQDYQTFDYHTYDDMHIVRDRQRKGLYIFGEIFEIILLLSTVLHCFGVYGAIYYKSNPIKVAAISYAIPFTYSLFSFNLTGTLLTGFFLYPHIVLLKEIENGIMTPYNYENIKSCCVC